jgi:ATP-dependent DNA helicase RecQ
MEALRLLNTVFGHPGFRGAQREIVDHVAGGGDALVLMPTGGGKSLCYQLPALLREGTGVVVSPLIALMQDQVAALRQLGVRAAFLNSSLNETQSRETQRAFRAGEFDLLYVAPERLLMPHMLEILKQVKLALFAIDEAHCVSQWGHDFRPEYLQLSVLHERFPEVPRIALTATADPQTRDEIVRRLALEEAELFVSSFDRPNIRYTIVDKDQPREQLLRFIREEHAGEAGIVYCLSRKKVDETAAWLAAEGMKALPYHAGMDAASRTANQERFQREDGVVIVATIAFGMGIDKPDVRFVAHLDLPKSVEGYYQETGRAGRDGLPADAWMAYGLQDVVQLRRMIDESAAGEAQKRIQAAKLDAMLGLCETAECRRVRLLAYFGEAAAPCGNCDTCLDPPATFDGTLAAQQLLSCLYRTGQRFGAMHVIDVLRGEATDKVVQRGHDKLSTFGIGHDRGGREWRAIIRQCIALGLLEVDYEAYGALRLTGESRAVLKGERNVALRAWREPKRSARAKAARETASATLSGAALELFERLRAWRVEAARRHGVPAYVIFHDATLREIARLRPASLDTLRGISGIGARKLEAYGEDIVGLVKGA